MTLHERLVPVGVLATLLLALAAGAFFMTARTAHAEIKGNCQATIAGTNVAGISSTKTGDAIDVEENSSVAVNFTSATGFSDHEVTIEFMGGLPGAQVEKATDDGSTEFSDTVKVDDYAWAGVGLYKVKGKATLSDGTTCSGAALVNVKGNPLTTVAGGVAVGAAALGTVAGVATAANGIGGGSGQLASYNRLWEELDRVDETLQRQRAEEENRRERERRAQGERAVDSFVFWLLHIFGVCLVAALAAVVLVPFMAIGSGGSQGTAAAPAGTEGPKRLPRAPWSPRITLVGIIGGILGGAGLLVLLQQYAVTYPSLGLVICVLALGAAAYGLALPTLGSTIGWMRTNGRLAAMERKLGW